MLGMSLSIFGLASLELSAQKAFSLVYHFDGVTKSSGTWDPTPAPAVSGVAGGSFHAVGYTGSATTATQFSWKNNALGGIDGDDNFADFTGQLDNGRYFEVSFTPDASCAVDFDSIYFEMRRSATGVRSYAVRSSLDDFSVNLPAVTDPGATNLGVGPDNSFRWLVDDRTTPGRLVANRIVLGSAQDGLTVPITFRFYGWNAEGNDGVFGIDDVSFYGKIRTVPEAGIGGVWLLGLLGLGFTSARPFRCRGRSGPVAELLRQDRRGRGGCRELRLRS
jgi:hypothetical protein